MNFIEVKNETDISVYLCRYYNYLSKFKIDQIFKDDLEKSINNFDKKITIKDILSELTGIIDFFQKNEFNDKDLEYINEKWEDITKYAEEKKTSFNNDFKNNFLKLVKEKKLNQNTFSLLLKETVLKNLPLNETESLDVLPDFKEKDFYDNLSELFNGSLKERKKNNLSSLKKFIKKEINNSFNVPQNQEDFDALSENKKEILKNVSNELNINIEFTEKPKFSSYQMPEINYKITNRCFGVENEIGKNHEMNGNYKTIEGIFRKLGISYNPEDSLIARNFLINGKKGWRISYDAGAIEIISPILSGEEGVREVYAVMSELNKKGIDGGIGQGLHIHNDTRDLKGKNGLKIYKRALLRYLENEVRIDKENPEYRKTIQGFTDGGNNLLRPIAYHLKPPKGVSKKEYAVELINRSTTIEELKKIFPNRAVTFSIKSNFETMEARHKQATTNPDSVVEWVYRLNALIDDPEDAWVFQYGTKEGMRRKQKNLKIDTTTLRLSKRNKNCSTTGGKDECRF